MSSPKTGKTSRPESASGVLISLTVQILPPIAGRELNDKLKKCQVDSGKYLFSRSISDPRRYSIDDSMLDFSVKGKQKFRKVSATDSSRRCREFEDVDKPETPSSADDCFLG